MQNMKIMNLTYLLISDIFSQYEILYKEVMAFKSSKQLKKSAERVSESDTNTLRKN